MNIDRTDRCHICINRRREYLYSKSDCDVFDACDQNTGKGFI